MVVEQTSGTRLEDLQGADFVPGDDKLISYRDAHRGEHKTSD